MSFDFSDCYKNRIKKKADEYKNTNLACIKPHLPRHLVLVPGKYLKRSLIIF